MKNREKTFYKLTSDSNLNEIYKLSESTESDMFFKMGWWTKYGANLRIYNNNIAFLDKLEGFENLSDLKEELQFQLDKRQHNYTQKDWLEHTLFICKDRFKESGKEILNEAIKWCNLPPNKPTTKNTYTLKAIKIAYFLLGEFINKNNYKEILNLHSNSTSNKILQEQIFKNSQLRMLGTNKTASTKHLKSLNEAKQLLSSGQIVTSGKKIENALNSLKQIISTFSSNYNNEYN